MAKIEKRKDDKRSVLKKGETQRDNGTYDYRWTDKRGNRHAIYAKTLSELREKEKQITKDTLEGLKSEGRSLSLDDIFNVWKSLKRGIRDNTMSNYIYMYETFIKPSIGKSKITSVKKSDVKRFYNYLVDQRGLQPSTVDGINNVLHQLFDMAVDDMYIRINPATNVLKELKKSHAYKSEQRHALTKDQQNLFLSFLKSHNIYSHWYPIFAVMVGTGLRVGELTGLRWCDIDLDNDYIDVNHTLIYFSHRIEKSIKGNYYTINKPKTVKSERQIPMLDFVKEAFMMEKEYQKLADIKCQSVIDGYTDFIFLNYEGNVQNSQNLNRTIKRVIRDCNDAEFLKDENPKVLLPNFSCHSLRHTFTTRLCEAGVNVKVIQDVLGHTDITTTLNIYAEATKDMKKKAFDGLDKLFSDEDLI